MSEHILLRHRDIPDLDQLKVYTKNGGFEAWKKVVTSMEPAELIQLAKDSGLRGRGGAGFPTGMKWSFVPDNLWPHYVVANADESEPGTFKDREIMESNPFQFLEGLMIASFAVQAKASYAYLRGEFWQIGQKLEEKIAELEKAGFLGDNLFDTKYSLHLYVHMGAGAYICGEETALLESIEGKLGQPRLRPPFPAVAGLYASPTVINNVETLTNLPPIVQNGVTWFRGHGTEKSPGVKVFSLSGCINKPGNYELPLGATFRQLAQANQANRQSTAQTNQSSRQSTAQSSSSNRQSAGYQSGGSARAQSARGSASRGGRGAAGPPPVTRAIAENGHEGSCLEDLDRAAGDDVAAAGLHVGTGREEPGRDELCHAR